MFNTSMRDEAPRETTPPKDLEEEKEGGLFSQGNQATMFQSMTELLHDDTLGLDDLTKREIAHSIFDYMWILCQESSVSQHDLSLQSHKQAIEDLCHLITLNYPSALVNFIGRCIGCLQLHQSTMSMHVILQKLIQNAHYPLAKDSGKTLPQNRQELILSLDKVVNLTNVCLSSYIEFKRISLNYIFD